MENQTSLIAFDEINATLFLELNCYLNSPIEEVIVLNKKWGLFNSLREEVSNTLPIRMLSIPEMESVIPEQENHVYIVTGYNIDKHGREFYYMMKNHQNHKFLMIECNISEIETDNTLSNVVVYDNNAYKLKKVENNKIVIYILSTSTNDAALQTQVFLQEKMCKLGFQVASFSDRKIAPLFGIEYIEHYMESNVSLEERVEQIHDFLGVNPRYNSANIVLVGVHCGIDMWETHSVFYGELYYLLCRILKPDFCILNLPLNALMNTWLKDNRKLLNAALMNKIDCYAIANCYYDKEQSEEYNRDTYISCIDEELYQLIEDNLCDTKICIYNDAESIWNQIKMKLSRNEYIIKRI